jgi:Sec-independent protein secretion pathway component TatC
VEKKEMSFVLAILIIFGLAFASPFLAGFENIMGLIIIAIALYEAWKLNKRVPVSGPFRMATAQAAGAPVGPAAGGL